eukprot:scaffold22894_cov26-Tisochrysis_lutea.AAC.1
MILLTFPVALTIKLVLQQPRKRSSPTCSTSRPSCITKKPCATLKSHCLLEHSGKVPLHRAVPGKVLGERSVWSAWWRARQSSKSFGQSNPRVACGLNSCVLWSDPDLSGNPFHWSGNGEGRRAL